MSEGRRGLLRLRNRLLIYAVLVLLLVWEGCATCYMPGKSHRGPLPALSAQEAELAHELRRHVVQLAGGIGERNFRTPSALAEARRYIEGRFRELGYAVEAQTYAAEGLEFTNVIAEVRGATRPQEIIVVGAHYDSVFDSPGANDNASGTAALLELARLLCGHRPARTLRLVAFVNEEPPYFQGPRMGSRVYVRRCAQRRERIDAMLSLETIGHYDDAPGSQVYPSPFNLVYPDTGNFAAFVGNRASRALVRRVVASFRSHTAFPSEGVSAPGWIQGIGWSDHWSFWRHGYPALMVTDTAPFRYPHYHTTQDTPDKLDYERMARVVGGIERVLRELLDAGARDP